MNEFRNADLDELNGMLGKVGSLRSQEIEMEYLRRQTKAQQDAAAAQVDAAKHAKRNVSWVKWSVIVLALSSVVQAVLMIAR